MGGNDYILPVLPDYNRLLLPYLESENRGLGGLLKSFMARLFPSSASLIELPSAPLSNELLTSFRGWINAKLPSPSVATTAFISTYLDDIGGEALVKGQRPEPGEMPQAGQWFLHVSFEDAGGTAEISSLVACHWMDIWWRENRTKIGREILAPHGVWPSDPDESPARYGLFFPVDKFGYALYLPPGKEIKTPEGNLSFMLDGWLEDYHSPEETAEIHRSLKSGVPVQLSAGKCLCQLCAESA